MRVPLGYNRIAPGATATYLQRATAGTGSITGASNASPIVITSASHGLATGDIVTIVGVLGNTAANGTWTVTKIDANTFSLNSSTGNGAYTSAGTWYCIPAGTQFISLTADTAGIRYTTDGKTTPTATLGALIPINIPPVVIQCQFENFQFIQAAASGALNIEFFKDQ